MIEAVLFDLGGVLESVSAAPQVESWTRGAIPVDEFWHRWLAADSVRSFESGRIGPDEFYRSAILELGLGIDVEEFSEGFLRWPAGPMEGAADLVTRVRKRGFRVASFSNSNEIHWPTMRIHQRTDELFEANFPSHILGMCKPDLQAFREVARRWGIVPDRILFLDDNEVNCRGAREAGLVAKRVSGVREAEEVLRAEGLLQG